MSLPTWHDMPLSKLTPDAGLHYDDPGLVQKLATSLQRHGQLRPVVVRQQHGLAQVVDGRQLLKAMTSLGWTTCKVADVGTVDNEGAARMALDLEVRLELDYSRVAQFVANLLAMGATPGSLAVSGPYTSERIAYMGRLATFDWSQFQAEPDEQQGFGWDLGDLASPSEPQAAPEPFPGALPITVESSGPVDQDDVALANARTLASKILAEAEEMAIERMSRELVEGTSKIEGVPAGLVPTAYVGEEVVEEIWDGPETGPTTPTPASSGEVQFDLFS